MFDCWLPAWLALGLTLPPASPAPGLGPSRGAGALPGARHRASFGRRLGSGIRAVVRAGAAQAGAGTSGTPVARIQRTGGTCPAVWQAPAPGRAPWPRLLLEHLHSAAVQHPRQVQHAHMTSAAGSRPVCRGHRAGAGGDPASSGARRPGSGRARWIPRAGGLARMHPSRGEGEGGVLGCAGGFFADLPGGSPGDRPRASARVDGLMPVPCHCFSRLQAKAHRGPNELGAVLRAPGKASSFALRGWGPHPGRHHDPGRARPRTDLLAPLLSHGRTAGELAPSSPGTRGGARSAAPRPNPARRGCPPAQDATQRVTCALGGLAGSPARRHCPAGRPRLLSAESRDRPETSRPPCAHSQAATPSGGRPAAPPGPAGCGQGALARRAGRSARLRGMSRRDRHPGGGWSPARDRGREHITRHPSKGRGLSAGVQLCRPRSHWPHVPRRRPCAQQTHAAGSHRLHRQHGGRGYSRPVALSAGDARSVSRRPRHSGGHRRPTSPYMVAWPTGLRAPRLEPGPGAGLAGACSPPCGMPTRCGVSRCWAPFGRSPGRGGEPLFPCLPAASWAPVTAGPGGRPA